MQRSFLSLLLVFFIHLGTSKAQQSCALSIKGQVALTGTNMPISGISVSLVEAKKSLQTDKAGRFNLTKLCVGTHTLTLRAVGFIPASYTLNLRADTTLSLVMEKDFQQLQSVKVTATQAGSLSSSTHGLSRQQLEENKGRLLAETLTEVAGVTTMTMGSTIAKPIINGMHSQRILMLNNGVRHEGQQWGAEHAPEIDPFVADRIEVIKGAQGVQYGADALAGVILVAPRQIATDKALSGKADLIGRSNGRGMIGNIALEGGVKALPNFGWRAQLSGKKIGNYRSADYMLGNTGVRELNYSVAAQYSFKKNEIEAFYSHFGTDIGIFEGAHIGTVEDLRARIARGYPFETYNFSYNIQAPKQRVDHDLFKLSWKHQLSDERSLNFQYSIQRNHRLEYDRRRIESDNTPMADMQLTTQGFETIYKSGEQRLGVQANLQVNNNKPGTGTTPIIPNFDSFNLGVFASRTFQLRQLQAELGIRYDYKHLDAAGYRYDYQHPDADGVVQQYLMSDSRQFHNVSGTAGISYPISSNLTWKSNLGLAWRAPSANELYSDGLHHGSATYEVGDKNLKSEKGLKWNNAFIWRGEKIQLTADLYGQVVFDYIYAQPNPDSVRQTIRGTFPLFAYKQNDALFYGADLSAKYTLTNALAYTLDVSLVRARNLTLKEYLPYIPSDQLRQSLQWTINGPKSSVNYLKLAHRFVAKQTRYDVGSDYTAPPAAYHLIDLLASSTFPVQHQKNMNILIGVDNLFNTAYKDYMDRFRYFAHQMGRNVTLKISYEF